MSSLRLDLAEANRPERSSPDAGKPRHDPRQARRAAMVLGQHAKRGLPTGVQHRRHNQGALGDEVAIPCFFPNYPRKNTDMNIRIGLVHPEVAAMLLVWTLGNPPTAKGADHVSFAGEKTAWHGGFDRYD